MADTDHSGELDYDEFKNAVQNYGLKQLSSGSLRTLFDSFDGDGSGSISHEEFASSIKHVPEAPAGEPNGANRRSGPLQRPAILEPKRVGFEATPPVLALGELHVGVAYRAALTVLNVGDNDLRLTVKLEGFDGARDRNPVSGPRLGEKRGRRGAAAAVGLFRGVTGGPTILIKTNAQVRLVARPCGPLAPGLRTRVYLEVLVRAPGTLDMQVCLSSGLQVVDVPLSATFARRTTNAIPLSSAKFGDDDAGTIRTYRESTVRLPKYLQRLQTAKGAAPSFVPKAVSRDVWPTNVEIWKRIQQQTGEAAALLSSMAALRTCPQKDLNSVCVRLQRFRAPHDTKLIAQGDETAKRRMLFIAKGVGDVYPRPAPKSCSEKF